MAIQLGYCTNVHAGPDLEQTRANLERYALAVRNRYSPSAPMGVGLWLANSASQQLLEGARLRELADWLQDVGLVPFTLNGFPFGDFHDTVVKHRVYLPAWDEPDRLEYTSRLIRILDGLLPPGMAGSISTLPIAWGTPAPNKARLQKAAAALRLIADQLAELEAQRGRFICLCLEPEPGCVLDHGIDVVRFFEDYLLPGSDERRVRRYLQVCHDVCHAAVMFEKQADVLQCYRKAGIGVGKVQVSAAVAVPLASDDFEERRAALRQLSEFVEERYLHQTVVRNSETSPPLLYEDLPLALRSDEARHPSGEWRVHFHVPVYLREFGHLRATQGEILECLAITAGDNEVTHYEVETYAWVVLPEELRTTDLAEGIAKEMLWLREKLSHRIA